MIEWRPAPGYVGTYEVSSEGDLRRVESGRVLKRRMDEAGIPRHQR